ncbi:MAG: PAS domain S-box protein [Alphaproteobacteria bacterium]|nr:PAS domain S-box protein [Alphaproteobacteria bacterium]
MSLDNIRFIARHHGPLPHKASLTRPHDWAGLAIVTLAALAFALLLATVYMKLGQHNTHAIGGMMLALALGFGLIAYVSHRQQTRMQREFALLREVLEGSRGARMVTDAGDQTLYSNGKFDLLCHEIGPPSLKSLIELFGEASEPHIRFMAEQARRGLTETVEMFSRYGGREQWLMVTAQPVRDYPDFVHWRLDDISQKHAADRAIREEREKLIDFTDNAPVGFFSVDENGRFIFANATFARWLGEDLQALLERGHLHTYLAHPPAQGRPYDLIDRPRTRQVVEVPMKGAGGRLFLASVNQSVVREQDGTVRTRAVVYDLTAEQAIREALAASEDRFRRFFEEAPLGILQIDPHGKITEANAAFAAMLGVAIDAIEDQPLSGFISAEEGAPIQIALEKITHGGVLEGPLEVSLKGARGLVAAQMYARKFREGGSIVLHFIDVSARKSLEAQFVQSQKMQAIGQLAGGVAHDFNNLLTAMIGFCDLLLLRHKPGDPSFADLMQIKQNANRAANLVRQLLAFSRQQTLRTRVQDVTDILTEISHLLRRLIGAGIELDLIHGQDLGLVKVDEGQMEQVLINLAVNARDAMEGRGRLSIATENFTNRKPMDLVAETLPSGHWVRISVIDTGCGIEPDNLSRIFEPFFTTKEVGQGTGLGLATVYGIIRQTGGFLDVQSKPGQGATFHLYLPRVTDSEAVVEPPSNQAEEESTRDLTGSERILLVEDEDAVRTFAARALTNKGYEVLAAENGQSALAILESQGSKKLDLLVTDVVMPGMDGQALAQKIRAVHPEMKIIFISGYTEDKLKDTMGKGIYFLPKPFSLKQLAAKVKDVLAER